jgi:hypothetical protein
MFFGKLVVMEIARGGDGLVVFLGGAGVGGVNQDLLSESNLRR